GRRVTADVLWPGMLRKGKAAAAEEDFEADFREFERGMSDDEAEGGGGEVRRPCRGQGGAPNCRWDVDYKACPT
ncbi:hypothetical protein L9G15_22075, partial [Shewanella sp. A3A]|nr:hypothetical protein [Shewanella ferrihydritica]